MQVVKYLIRQLLEADYTNTSLGALEQSDMGLHCLHGPCLKTCVLR